MFELLKIAINGAVGLFTKKEEGRITEAELDAGLAELENTLKMQVEMTYRQEVDAKKAVMVAELQQDDNYTKRARPTLLYSGLVAAIVEAALRAVALFGGLPEGVELPASFFPGAFWMAWGGVAGVYAIGRTVEKRAANGQVSGDVLNAIANAATRISP
jgi:hypothetical protein